MNIERKKINSNLMWLAPVKVPNLVRLGKDFDGGYVLNKDSMTASDSLLSFGINDDWSFEVDWKKIKPKDKIHSYDGTISPSRMPDKLKNDYKAFFGNKAEHFPINIGKTPGFGQSSFDDALIRLNKSQAFIKMDIEGAEWQLTESIVNAANIITGMVIEFHNTDSLRPLFLDTMKTYQEYFDIIHVHPNTSCPYAEDNFPTVVEITFLNKSFNLGKGIRTECHIPELDQANTPNSNDVALYF
jgi:hypothetical protein